MLFTCLPPQPTYAGILHRIDEGFFDFVEDQDSRSKNAERHGERDAKITWSANILTDKHISNGNDGHFHGVERGDPSPLFRDLRDGINDRGGIHPELNDGGGEESEIAVFRREGGEPEADAEREGGDLEDDQGKGQNVPTDVDGWPY